MKLTNRALLIAIVVLALVAAVTAQTRGRGSAPVNGVYENFTVGAGSGDLEGMRVVIFSAHDERYAIVQIAQGGAEDPVPELVKIDVTGMKVSFTVGSESYKGTISSAGLKLNGNLLKRKPNAQFFR